ncbi:MAG: MlaC/ttg2D family ABC transporter substrate-binding protein, partial [Alphaproteobacteria bacterium]
MRRLQNILIVLFMSAVFINGPVQAETEEYVVGAEQFVRDLADEAITALTQDSLSREERQELFREMLNDGFAIPGIARFVMGRYWREATPEEREEYFHLFEESIVSLWANRFIDYSGQTFRITEAIPARSARADERAVLVRTLFWSKPSDPVRLDWRVANKG